MNEQEYANSEVTQSNNFRRKAERRLRDKQAATAVDMAEIDARALLHELQVHQIELEMQNEDLRTTQMELRATRARYFKLYDLAPVGYITLSEQGLILEANLTATTLLGVERDALVQKTLSSFILSEDQDAYFRHRNNLFATREPQICELRMLRENAGPFWVRMEATVSRDDDGELVCWVAMSNISPQKEMEHRQALSMEVQRILIDPLALSDAIHGILNAIQQATGFDAVGIRFRGGDDFPYFSQKGFTRDFLLAENALTVRGQDGGVCRDEVGNLRLECTCGLVLSGKTDPASPLFTLGGSFWTNDSLPLLNLPAAKDPRLHPRNRCVHEGFRSMALIPIRAGQDIVGLLQLNDRKKDCFTLEVIHFFEGISANIGVALMRTQWERDLVEAKAAAEAANVAKGQFLAHMSHELRTPMNAILGMLDLALPKVIDPTAQDCMQTAKESADLLLAILNDLLDSAKIESGKLELELAPFSLRRMLDKIARVLSARANENGLCFSCRIPEGTPDTVLGDSMRLQQVLLNLAGNAIKFTPKGEVVVQVEDCTSQIENCKLKIENCKLKIEAPSPKPQVPITKLPFAICNLQFPTRESESPPPFRNNSSIHSPRPMYPWRGVSEGRASDFPSARASWR